MQNFYTISRETTKKPPKTQICKKAKTIWVNKLQKFWAALLGFFCLLPILFVSIINFDHIVINKNCQIVTVKKLNIFMCENPKPQKKQDNLGTQTQKVLGSSSSSLLAAIAFDSSRFIYIAFESFRFNYVVFVVLFCF